MLEALKRLLLPQAPTAAPKAGLRHFAREVDGQPVRYHLRVERDGSGLLIANASAAVRLSPVGVSIAGGLLARTASEEQLAKQLVAGFSGATAEQARKDVSRVQEVLDELADPRGAYPLRSLDDDPEAGVHRRTLSAPLCADVVVSPSEPVSERLAQLWTAAVPQVVLIPSTDTKGSELVSLVEHAEDLGLIAGVRGRASALADEGLLRELAQAGLDHLDLLYAGDQGAHDGLLGDGDHETAEGLFEQARALEVCPVAVLPLVSSTFDGLPTTLERLAELDVPALTIFAIISDAVDREGTQPTAVEPAELLQAANSAEQLADRQGLNLVWAPPLEQPRSGSLVELVRSGPRACGEASARIEANGDVLPPTGRPERTGNIDTDRWETIWRHRAFDHYREAVDEPERCDECPGLAMCAGGCPKDPASWARTTKGGTP